MAHQVETHVAADGTVQAAALYAREPAWHRLGETLPAGLTAADVLDRGHLGGWGVRRSEKPVLDPDSGMPVEGFYAVTRANPFTKKRETFGVVGGIWAPVQNEDTLDLLDAIKGQTGGEFDAAVSLRGGRAVAVTTKIPDSLLIGGVDAVDRYLAMINYHDGTGSLIVMDTLVRVVCANTEHAALQNHRSLVKIRHTTSAMMSVAEVRRALGITFKFDAAFQEEAERMIQATMSEAQFVTQARKVYPRPKDMDRKRAVTIQLRREEKLIDLFQNSPTMSKIKGTRWAGYNAVTEYLDWETPVGAKRDAAKVRAARTLEPRSRVNDVKALAFAAFSVPAKGAKR